MKEEVIIALACIMFFLVAWFFDASLYLIKAATIGLMIFYVFAVMEVEVNEE